MVFGGTEKPLLLASLQSYVTCLLGFSGLAVHRFNRFTETLFSQMNFFGNTSLLQPNCESEQFFAWFVFFFFKQIEATDCYQASITMYHMFCG